MRGLLRFWVWLFSGVVVDQLVKAWVRTSIAEGQSMNGPWPGVFEIKLTYNHGIAFGLFQGAGHVFTPVALAIAIGTGWYCWKHPKEGYWGHATMGMLAAGAVGNLIDRVWMGKVTDMFWFRPINFPVFNIADALITVSAAVLLIRSSFEPSSRVDPALPGEPPLASPIPRPDDSDRAGREAEG